MKPVLLVLLPLPDTLLATFGQSYEVLHAPNKQGIDALIAARHEQIRLVLTNGTTGITTAEVDALPKLELICVLGAGHEGVDLEHARARGVAAVNGAGTNDTCVADHAFALLLAVVRDIPGNDRAVREGRWRDALPMQPTIAGKRLGIVGLGAVGRKIARRAAGFEMAIGYHNRTRRQDTEYTYFEQLDALAHWSDVLIIATPGGPSTRHLIDAKILGALGPAGFLVNIARGSVVDTAALASALRSGGIAGAGLDVYESEPAPPLDLLGFPHVVLSPHLAGRSPDALQASAELFLDNAARHLAGAALLTPI